MPRARRSRSIAAGDAAAAAALEVREGAARDVVDHLLHAEKAEDEERGQVDERHEARGTAARSPRPASPRRSRSVHEGERTSLDAATARCAVASAHPQEERDDAPEPDRDQHRPDHQPEHARMQQVGRRRTGASAATLIGAESARVWPGASRRPAPASSAPARTATRAAPPAASGTARDPRDRAAAARAAELALRTAARSARHLGREARVALPDRRAACRGAALAALR